MQGYFSKFLSKIRAIIEKKRKLVDFWWDGEGDSNVGSYPTHIKFLTIYFSNFLQLDI